MIHSLKLSNAVLRFGLAIIFLWLGIDKFIHPEYWTNAWVSDAVVNLFAAISIKSTELIFLAGIVETLIAVGILANVWIKPISFIGAVYVVIVSSVGGSVEVAVRNIPIIASFSALILWPDRRGL